MWSLKRLLGLAAWLVKKVKWFRQSWVTNESMTRALYEPKSYLPSNLGHHYILSLIGVRSWKETVLLLWIQDMTPAAWACYMCAGNSQARQGKTWTAEMTESERPRSVCFAWEQESARNNCRTVQAQLLMITPAVKRNRWGYYEDDEKVQPPTSTQLPLVVTYM